MPATGLVTTGQIEITYPPTQDNHGVRRVDLSNAANQFAYQGILLSDLFPGIVLSAAIERTAIIVLPNGTPSTVGAGDDKATGLIGVRFGNFLFTDGKIAKNWASGMQPGLQYFLGDDGGVTGVIPTAAGRWVIRLGIALNATDMLFNFSIQGKL